MLVMLIRMMQNQWVRGGMLEKRNGMLQMVQQNLPN
jgi:hypothetical protein